MSLVAALVTLSAFACAGTDRLTDPVVSHGGSYFASLGGNPSASGGASSDSRAVTSTVGSGGTTVSPGSGGSQTSGGSQALDTTFDWDDTDYDVNGGSDVLYQENHFAGMACFATCHDHTITAGGTVYGSDGKAAANAQLGILADGTLSTMYSGSQGNFFVTIDSSVDWAAAQIAVRNSNGTLAMPVNANASGDCNRCHNSKNRIVVP